MIWIWLAIHINCQILFHSKSFWEQFSFFSNPKNISSLGACGYQAKAHYVQHDVDLISRPHQLSKFISFKVLPWALLLLLCPQNHLKSGCLWILGKGPLSSTRCGFYYPSTSTVKFYFIQGRAGGTSPSSPPPKPSQGWVPVDTGQRTIKFNTLWIWWAIHITCQNLFYSKSWLEHFSFFSNPKTTWSLGACGYKTKAH